METEKPYKLNKRDFKHITGRWLEHHFIGRFEVKSSYKKTVDIHLKFMDEKYSYTFDIDVLWRWYMEGWQNEFEREMKQFLTEKGHYVEQKQTEYIYM